MVQAIYGRNLTDAVPTWRVHLKADSSEQIVGMCSQVINSSDSHQQVEQVDSSRIIKAKLMIDEHIHETLQQPLYRNQRAEQWKSGFGSAKRSFP
jgi:hypothetical protein